MHCHGGPWERKYMIIQDLTPIPHDPHPTHLPTGGGDGSGGSRVRSPSRAGGGDGCFASLYRVAVTFFWAPHLNRPPGRGQALSRLASLKLPASLRLRRDKTAGQVGRGLVYDMPSAVGGAWEREHPHPTPLPSGFVEASGFAKASPRQDAGTRR